MILPLYLDEPKGDKLKPIQIAEILFVLYWYLQLHFDSIDILISDWVIYTENKLCTSKVQFNQVLSTLAEKEVSKHSMKMKN